MKKICFNIVPRKYFSQIRSDICNLNYSIVEGADPTVKKHLVFLHGLFGNQNNWRPISYSESIRSRRNSILIDMRNHGDSQHHESMRYPEMAEDVINLIDKLGINKFTLLGHSMGAKIAMNVGTKIPDRLDGLIIVDSAPKDNMELRNIKNKTLDIIDKVSSYNVEGKSRKEVIEDFKKMFDSSAANLLNTNLTYISPDSDKVKWRSNITSIKNNAENILGYESDHGKVYTEKILVLVGEKSHHFPIDVFKQIFPKISEDDIVVVKGAGHWVHADKPGEVIANISKFLDKIDNKI
jgi:pimeloyl-ACP methyl ester carboxylesterase